MFYGINDLPTFVLGTIFIVLLPGPNSLYVMAVASRFGVAAGYRGAAGIFVGDTVLMVLSATGMASLLASTPALFTVLKSAGAAYLAWIGLTLLRGAWRSWPRRGTGRVGPAREVDGEAGDDTVEGGDGVGARNPGRPFRTALVISLMNPKAILFFVSFFIQFVAPGYEHPALSFLILGLIVQVCSALYLSALIFGGATLASQFRRRERLAALATGAVGALFIGFGARLAGASLR